MHLEAGERAVILGAIGDLHRKFARRGQHQHAAGFERDLLVGLAQPVDAGKHEGGGLAGAGLGNAEQVATLENGRDGLFLDRGGDRVALHVEGLEHGLRQPEISKSCHVLLANYAARFRQSQTDCGRGAGDETARVKREVWG